MLNSSVCWKASVCLILLSGLAVWMPKVLSVGEQQRVAFARVLIATPRYAVLDEATSALDERNEDSLYQQVLTSQTTLISTGHRPSILKYHPQVLELTGNGGWQLYAAGDYRFKG